MPPGPESLETGSHDFVTSEYLQNSKLKFLSGTYLVHLRKHLRTGPPSQHAPDTAVPAGIGAVTGVNDNKSQFKLGLEKEINY